MYTHNALVVFTCQNRSKTCFSGFDVFTPRGTVLAERTKKARIGSTKMFGVDIVFLVNLFTLPGFPNIVVRI